VARGTDISIGTLAKVKYFSQSQSQFTGSSPENNGKLSLGLAIDRLKWGLVSLIGSTI
jgi:hypothetical protein